MKWYAIIVDQFSCVRHFCVRAGLEPIPPRRYVFVRLISESKGHMPVRFAEDGIEGTFSGPCKLQKEIKQSLFT